MTCCKEELIQDTSDIVDENLATIEKGPISPKAIQIRLVIRVHSDGQFHNFALLCKQKLKYILNLGLFFI